MFNSNEFSYSRSVFFSRSALVSNAPVSCRKDSYHASIQRHLYVYLGAVPDARAALAAGRVLYGRSRRLHCRAADAAAGKHHIHHHIVIQQYVHITQSYECL